MEYVIVWSYDNYVPAHIAMGRLQEDGIDCWLKDENTVTMNPLWGNALGGIKLMVAKDQAEKAHEILTQLLQDYRNKITCPKCGSHDLELVSSPRKPMTWLTALSTFFLGDYALTVDKVYHCFKCLNEFPEDQVIRTPDSE